MATEQKWKLDLMVKEVGEEAMWDQVQTTTPWKKKREGRREILFGTREEYRRRREGVQTLIAKKIVP